MSRKVEGQPFINSANRSNLFEVVVTLLIGGYREQSVVAAATLIFRQNLQRNIQEGYIYRCRGLLAVCAKPRAVIRACDDMLACECEAWYTKGGVWVMTKYDIKYSDLPQAVRTAFETSYGAQTPVDDVERLERNTGETVYFIEATIVVNGYLADIYFDYAPDGTLLRTAIDVEYYDNIYYYLP